MCPRGARGLGFDLEERLRELARDHGNEVELIRSHDPVPPDRAVAAAA